MPLKPARFLDPKADIVFKKIFGNHPELLKSFLNSVLPLPEGHLIETITYLPSEQVPKIPSMKNTIVDVKCVDQTGRVFIVEMQMQWQESFSKRLLFGVSKAYVHQLDKGEEYSTLCPVYGLGIINDVFDRSTDAWFHHYRSVNVAHPERVLEGLELIFMELPKFKPQTWQEKKLGRLWILFLKEISEKTQEVSEEFLEVPEITKALELSQESAYTKGELEWYDKYWDAVSTWKTIQGDSFREGYKEGRQEGIEQGIEKGREQGKLDVARSLWEQGISLEMISKATGLTEDAILSLEKN